MQAVSFDLWQTLMHDTKERAARRAELRIQRMAAALERAGRGGILDRVAEACHAVWSEWQGRYWDRLVDPGFDAQIGWLCERLDVQPGQQPLAGELRAAYVDPVFAVPPEVDLAAVPVLSQLHAHGLELGLICNTSVTPGFALRRLLVRWALDKLLTVQLFSDETGVRKPAPGMYLQLARELGVDIAALVHVGDQAEIDVAGAEAAGARGLLVSPDAPLSGIGDRLRELA